MPVDGQNTPTLTCTHKDSIVPPTYLAQVHHRLWEVTGPGVGAARAGVARLPVFVHDGLQDGGEGGDANTRGNENGVLGAENVT